ncbi:Ribonuclease H-like superfamily protein [Striga hermonthica]|uniref:Ribonuclease H-like superfamily protein n=1 Tax=Striga hermonthica TaxID=68872 RepID=A0A9N7MBM4_STRHE|nr:Ribonuclease H-like superfamily protein [Striga hermonthica]
MRTNSALAIERCKKEMEIMREEGEFKNWEVWNKCKKELTEAYNQEELYWKQKARITWLKEGDKNSRFFQASVRDRRYINSLDNLCKADGSRIRRYRMLQGHGETSEGHQQEKKMWRITWALPIQSKIKFFIWRCWHGYLAAKRQLVRKGMALDSKCDLCGEEEESIEHMLLYCHRAASCWKLSGLWWEDQKEKKLSFKDWWLKISNIQKKNARTDRLSLAALVLWNIWISRNEWSFQQKWHSEIQTATRAKDKWKEYQQAQEMTRGIKPLNQGPTTSQSEKFSKEVGQVRLSVSASSSEGGGIDCEGVAVKNDLELMKWSHTSSSIKDHRVGLMQGIRVMLQKLSELGDHNITCYVPDLQVVKYLRKELMCEPTIKKICEDIWRLRDIGPKYVFVFVPGT